MRRYKEDVRKDINAKQPQTSSVTMFKAVRPSSNQKVMRPGKTAKDHKSGAHARRIMNQITRASELADRGRRK